MADFDIDGDMPSPKVRAAACRLNAALHAELAAKALSADELDLAKAHAHFWRQYIDEADAAEVAERRAAA